MKNTSIHDCKLLSLSDYVSDKSDLDFLSFENFSLPFNVKRIYYLFKCPQNVIRGIHAHKNLFQIIVAINGNFDITIKDGTSVKTFKLRDPGIGLFVSPGIWREITNFSKGAVCLVLASELYDVNDYIFDYELYQKYKS